MENLNFVFVAPFTSRPSHLDPTSIFFNPAVTNLFLMGQCFPITAPFHDIRRLIRERVLFLRCFLVPMKW